MGYFVEVGSYGLQKHGQQVRGDVFISKKPAGGRTIAVLADGLGSGVKANVLATLTASMASNYVIGQIDITRAAEIILATLPVCKVRKIGYSTFTIVDVSPSGHVRIIEYDNPPTIILRGHELFKPQRVKLEFKSSLPLHGSLYYAGFKALPGDRIVFFSDGITQSGLGSRATPLGWEWDKLEYTVQTQVREHHGIAATELCRKIVNAALMLDAGTPRDDMTCACVALRTPRRTMVFSGPPYNMDSDKELARLANEFEGVKVICGGTTAKILARELGLELKVDLSTLDKNSKIPPDAQLDGFDLVSEGTITLSNATKMLDQGTVKGKDAAARLANIFLNSDVISFVVGTRVNEAHQDPSLPQELEIRRNLIKRLAKILEDKYMKQTQVRFV